MPSFPEQTLSRNIQKFLFYGNEMEHFRMREQEQSWEASSTEEILFSSIYATPVHNGQLCFC